MTRAQEVPAAIQWHEGMLLAPQHFQQLGARQERLLHYHVETVSPFHYGVRSLRLDNTLILEGTIRVIELEAILPDGLVVSYRKGEDADLQCDVRPQRDLAKQEPLTVHLAVPIDRPGAGKAEEDLGRWDSIQGDPVADEATGQRPLRIPRLRPRLRLLASPSPPARFITLPLLSLRFKNGSFIISDYVPPTLLVTPDSPLGEMCAGIARKVREKSMYLVETIRSPAMTTKPGLIEEHKRLLSYLTSGLPAFEAVLRCGQCHPFSLYTALCGLAGPISAVGNQLVPPVLGPYDHLNLRRCFDEVKDYLFRCMDEGISEAFTPVPCTFENGSFTVKFERDWMERILIVGVQGQPGTSDQQISDWMQSSLVGSESRFRVLRERRLLGVARQPIDRYEGLVATRGMLLFTLKPDAEFLLPGETLLISNAERPGVPRPADIFLFVGNKR